MPSSTSEDQKRVVLTVFIGRGPEAEKLRDALISASKGISAEMDMVSLSDCMRVAGALAQENPRKYRALWLAANRELKRVYERPRKKRFVINQN